MPASLRAALAAVLLSPFAALAQADAETADVITLPEELRPVPSEFEYTLEAELSAEARWFPQQARDPRQGDGGLSLAFQPEFYGEWRQGETVIQFTPFMRYDSMDSERSHLDVRELYAQFLWNRLELRAGISRVFWGKTELLHLVDVINQDDGVENLDGEDKLGQPMVRLNWSSRWGMLQAYLLPLFRERNFAGTDGRLRAPLYVDQDHPFYESSKLDEHVDYALRFQGYYGPLDYGVAFFDGTNRDPQLVPELQSDLSTVHLVPFYAQMQQFSLDAQLTLEGWLLKLEALQRNTARVQVGQNFQYLLRDDDYWAATGGFEYTFYGLYDSAMDLGLLVEYMVDERGDDSDQIFQNDVFVGGRLAANDVHDSALLGGLVVDLDNDGLFFNLEASRRLDGSSKLSVEVRAFINIDAEDPLWAVSRDDLLQVEYTRYF